MLEKSTTTPLLYPGMTGRECLLAMVAAAQNLDSESKSACVPLDEETCFGFLPKNIPSPTHPPRSTIEIIGCLIGLEPPITGKLCLPLTGESGVTFYPHEANTAE